MAVRLHLRHAHSFLGKLSGWGEKKMPEEARCPQDGKSKRERFSDDFT